MTLDNKIEELFDEVAPVTSEWNESDEHCIVYEYTVSPGIYGDDIPELYIASGKLHLFAPVGVNITDEKRQISAKLDAPDGFMMFTGMDDASDLSYQHIVYDFQALVSAEEVDLGGEI